MEYLRYAWCVGQFALLLCSGDRTTWENEWDWNHFPAGVEKAKRRRKQSNKSWCENAQSDHFALFCRVGLGLGVGSGL